MSFAGKNLTQGGQMTAYRWRMFFQVNNWIGFWIFILFAVLAAVIFFLRIPQEVFDNGSLWWFSSINSSFINLMPPGTPKLYDIHYWYAATQTQMVLKMTLPQILTDPYMTAMGEQFFNELQWAVLVKQDWINAVKSPERDIKTAHDALAPETQRKQAKAIWSMGQPVSKTAIGRAWLRHQNMHDSSLTAKIIPATRRFPEPALALPVYDNNGKSSGLVLVSLVASNEGRLTHGETRMVMSERGRGALLQRSKSGNTVVVSELSAALDAVRNRPEDGVFWQVGTESLSAQLIKVSGGERRENEEISVQRVSRESSEIILPETEQNADKNSAVDISHIREQDEARKRTEESLAADAGKSSGEAAEPLSVKIIQPTGEELNIKPEIYGADGQKDIPEPDKNILRSIASSEERQEIDPAKLLRAGQEIDAGRGADISGVSRQVTELARNERDIARQTNSIEHGRLPEREEQSLTRTIQKER
ncbi:conjugative transfer relaxase/helicase TraI domain-containing protein [Citrobacter freundii]|uniref:conjugative transfer relaxase/helicase TraI domain-containing protein n=1 Tax=Citrobacter freundii TaxID=546 RepID=UPI001CE26997|nr:conjugative transfer relaxase/helicase TraI domain-containing protein [Citrobacter freundii]